MSAPCSLEVEDLVKHFPVRAGLLQRQRGIVRAVDRVSFSISRGETLGLVGESGCGKTTLSRMVLKLIEPTAGRIRLGGFDVTGLSQGAMWEHRRRVQIVFQDPYSSAMATSRHQASIRASRPAPLSASRWRTSVWLRATRRIGGWRTSSSVWG